MRKQNYFIIFGPLIVIIFLTIVLFSIATGTHLIYEMCFLNLACRVNRNYKYLLVQVLFLSNLYEYMYPTGFHAIARKM